MEEALRRTLEEKIRAVTKKEIRIDYSENQGRDLPHCSKLGGRPSLPAGFVWPWYEGARYDGETVRNPLAFLAQINLAELAGMDEEGLLPESGMLSFFYELETMTWGFDPADAGSAKVYYFPEGSDLVPTEPPAAEMALPECALVFTQQNSLPDFEEFAFQDDYEWEDYDEVREAFGYEGDDFGERTKLLGYADLIQGSMKIECESISRRIYMGDPEGYRKLSAEEKADIWEKAEDWMLLFQMGTITVGGYELMFGDCGHIYYWIRKEDLRNRDFSKIWLVLQCS